MGLRAGADRPPPGRRGRTRGLAGRPGAGGSRTGRPAGFAQRARHRRPAGYPRYATLGTMSAQNPAVEALGVAVAARVPVLLWGAPGTGKTSAIRAMAGAMGLPCETVIASIREPSDFAGLPIVVGGEVRFAPPAWARLMAAAGAAGADDEARSALIRGAVGDGAGVEFLAWLVEMDLPDPERVLADPASFRLPERGDRAYAALAAIAAAVAADPTPARWTAGWQVLGLAADTAPDVAAVAARVLAKCRPPDADPPAEIHLFAPVLRDAGLL